MAELLNITFIFFTKLTKKNNLVKFLGRQVIPRPIQVWEFKNLCPNCRVSKIRIPHCKDKCIPHQADKSISYLITETNAYLISWTKIQIPHKRDTKPEIEISHFFQFLEFLFSYLIRRTKYERRSLTCLWILHQWDIF